MKPVRCSVKYFCLGSLLIFIGSVLLCAMGITVVLPYQKTRDWTEVTCEVSYTAYNRSICSCDQHEIQTDCTEVYPCLQVHVQYRYDVTSHVPSLICSTEKRSTINKNVHYVTQGSNCTYNSSSEVVIEEAMQQAVVYQTWGDSFFKTCSLHVCDEKQWNNRQVDKFYKTWGRSKQKYQCFANPLDLETVILDRTSYQESIHAMLWPSLCLLCGSTMWCGLYVGCWVIESKNDKGYCPQRTYIGMI